MNIQKEIQAGECVPKWYGISYIVANRAIAVAHPIPLNVIAGVWHNAKNWMRSGFAWYMMKHQADNAYFRNMPHKSFPLMRLGKRMEVVVFTYNNKDATLLSSYEDIDDVARLIDSRDKDVVTIVQYEDK